MSESKPTTYPENMEYEIDELNSMYSEEDRKMNLEYSMRLGQIQERYGIMSSVNNVRFDLLGMIIRQREDKKEKQNDGK